MGSMEEVLRKVHKVSAYIISQVAIYVSGMELHCATPYGNSSSLAHKETSLHLVSSRKFLPWGPWRKVLGSGRSKRRSSQKVSAHMISAVIMYDT